MSNMGNRNMNYNFRFTSLSTYPWEFYCASEALVSKKLQKGLAMKYS